MALASEPGSIHLRPWTFAGLQARLEAGIKVADVGCGSGEALRVLATAFPASDFHGFDTSRHALDAAGKHLYGHGVRNVTLHNPDEGDGMPKSSFDFVITVDAIHDMERVLDYPCVHSAPGWLCNGLTTLDEHLDTGKTREPLSCLTLVQRPAFSAALTSAALAQAHPDRVLPLVREAMSEGAVGWLIVDFRSTGSIAGNVREMRETSVLGYSFSVQLCMSSGLAEPVRCCALLALSDHGERCFVPCAARRRRSFSRVTCDALDTRYSSCCSQDGLGLGTLGWHEALAHKMLKAAGFASVETLDWESELNSFYLARP